MGKFLNTLATSGDFHQVEISEYGFIMMRRPDALPDGFNRLARAAIEGAGDDYVALPISDGGVGYAQVIIMPLDPI